MPHNSARGQWKSTDLGCHRITGHLFYPWWPSSRTSLPEKPQYRIFPKKTSAIQLLLSRKRGTQFRSEDPITMSPQITISTLTPWIASPRRWEASTEPRAQMPCAHAEHEWAVQFFFFNILSDNKLPVLRSILPVHCCASHQAYFVASITLFREIIICAQTHLKIIYSLFFLAQNETIKRHFKKDLSLPFTVKACWEKAVL